ncbi:hypothetical protein BHM03_00012781 [Ensete ventricosum]|nr:hypothetical protein BHM03_00012781 [Ensete ventricosum]
MIDEGEETEVGEAGSEAEGELYHHVVGMMGEDIRDDEVRDDDDDENFQEKEGSGDYCVLSVRLIYAHPPEIGFEVSELVAGTREVTCVRHYARQQRLDVVASGYFHDNASSRY